MSQFSDSFLWQPERGELDRYLAAADGDFYVFHTDRFQENCQRFFSAFDDLYPNVRMAYSVKTNYLPKAITEIDNLGWYSEVVSGFEYDLAKSLQVDGENIIFNGPIKYQDELYKAISDGAIINIDSINELYRIEEISRSNNLIAKVGVRLNFSETMTSSSRFGLAANKEARQAISYIQENANLEFNGLHAHYCFSGKKPEPYTDLVTQTIKFIDECSPDLWASIKVLNFGGGFFSPMPEKMAANWDYQIPSFDDYAKAITEPLNERLSNTKIKPPQLTLEPGLAIVADAMSFVCRVDNVKRIVNSDTAILSGSVYNIKPTKSPINLPWAQYPGGQTQTNIKGSLSGYTCMEDDIMASDYEGAIAPDDIFIFGNVGAYTMVLQPSFIRLAPAILSTKNTEIVTLVGAQTNSDFINYRLGRI